MPCTYLMKVSCGNHEVSSSWKVSDDGVPIFKSFFSEDWVLRMAICETTNSRESIHLRHSFHSPSTTSKNTGCSEVCSPLLTFPGLRQDIVMYLNWVCVNQESCEIHESCLWRFRNGCPTEPTDRQMPQMSSREWHRTRLPQDKQGINRNNRPGSIMEQERVSWDVGMRLLARWYKVLLPHLTSYEECPFTSWVLGKILRSHLWLNQGACFLWNLQDFWVNSHHIVTHFLTDFPVSWLTPLEGECLSLNSVAPWFWSTCRINMASRLSLKCLSATCCLQLST